MSTIITEFEQKIYNTFYSEDIFIFTNLVNNKYIHLRDFLHNETRENLLIYVNHYNHLNTSHHSKCDKIIKIELL